MLGKLGSESKVVYPFVSKPCEPSEQSTVESEAWALSYLVSKWTSAADAAEKSATRGMVIEMSFMVRKISESGSWILRKCVGEESAQLFFELLSPAGSRVNERECKQIGINAIESRRYSEFHNDGPCCTHACHGWKMKILTAGRLVLPRLSSKWLSQPS